MKEANGMKIKSYFAKTVDEAISKARVELGSEALLLNTRKIPDTGSGSSYEVVMGVAGAAGAMSSGPAPKAATPVPAPKPATRTAVAAAAESKPQVEAPRPEVAFEMEKLRAQMDELQSLLARQDGWEGRISFHGDDFCYNPTLINNHNGTEVFRGQHKPICCRGAN